MPPLPKPGKPSLPSEKKITVEFPHTSADAMAAFLPLTGTSGDNTYAKIFVEYDEDYFKLQLLKPNSPADKCECMRACVCVCVCVFGACVHERVGAFSVSWPQVRRIHQHLHRTYAPAPTHTLIHPCMHTLRHHISTH